MLYKFDFLNLTARQYLNHPGPRARSSAHPATKGAPMLSFLRPGGSSVSRIAAKDAIARAAKGELLVIDIRDGSEIAASGKAKGALHVPLAAFKMRCDPSSPECLAELSLEKPVALYCASGARSQMAAQMMAQMGYKEVYNLGGLYDWHAAGGEITR